MAKPLVSDITRSFRPNVFIPSTLIGIIDIYHFIPHSLTLTLAEGHNVSSKQNLQALFSRKFSTDHYDIWCDVETNQVELSESVFKVTFIALRETTVVVQTNLLRWNAVGCV